jgi:hypothetical protein
MANEINFLKSLGFNVDPSNMFCTSKHKVGSVDFVINHHEDSDNTKPILWSDDAITEDVYETVETPIEKVIGMINGWSEKLEEYNKTLKK